MHAVEVGIGPHVDDDAPEPLPLGAQLLATSDFDDGEKKNDDDDGKRYYDEYTGLELRADGVRASRQEELDFFEKLDVWDIRSRKEALQRSGRSPLGTRWIDTNKGDQRREEYRSRLVVQETRRASSIDPGDIAAVTSSTPPLEAMRVLLSACMTWTKIDGQDWVLQFLDISRAHPHCKVLRDNIYVEAPKELDLPSDACLLLKRCLYGTRDAPQAFEFKVKECMEALGLKQATFSPCIYVCERRRLVYVVHGDDFVGLGRRSSLSEVYEGLCRLLIVKHRGILGPRSNELKEVRILNRVVSYRVGEGSAPDMLIWEADHRHVQLIREHLGLTGTANTRATPADKEVFKKRPPLLGDELQPKQAGLYRSICMRLSYLALDRPDLMFVSKELARAASRPTTHAWEALKHVGRYLGEVPRVAWTYPRQHMVTTLHGLSDSDWAGCVVTRKSTTSTHVLAGRHMLVAAVSTQAIISLSSGESEFYGSVRSACRLLGVHMLMKDMLWETEPELVTDSSAAKGMASRRGAGSVRHIHCPALWLQQVIAQRRLRIAKRKGATLSADVGTKAGIPKARLWQLLGSVGVVRLTGTAHSQLDVAADSNPVTADTA